MIADLKPYPAVKDSGVPWLGAVPAHWEVLPNRALFTEVKERDHLANHRGGHRNRNDQGDETVGASRKFARYLPIWA